jgi:glycosyltransferase involved in cell wall biosynthesis
MKPLVSILIPCYNSELWLAQTLESALGQTWSNIEVILVDDGSTDNSLSIAKSYESCTVKVISQENQGASAARNRALKEAHGDFIQYLDADDLLALDKIERQLNILGFDGNSNSVAAGEWARFYKLPSESVFATQSLWLDLSPVDWLVIAWKENLMMHPAAWLVSRYITNLAGDWNESISLNDDGEYFCRVVLASKDIKFCWGAKSYYRSGTCGSLSSLKSRKAWDSAFLSVELCTKQLLAKENSDRTRYVAACCWRNFIFMAYPHVMDLTQEAEKNIRSLGGCNLKPDGGTVFEIIRDVFGWKIAVNLQKKFYKFRELI